MPNKIAITGGIGSGKSAVCRILKERGYPVFSCDEINRALLSEKSYLDGLCALFRRFPPSSFRTRKRLKRSTPMPTRAFRNACGATWTAPEKPALPKSPSSLKAA